MPITYHHACADVTSATAGEAVRTDWRSVYKAAIAEGDPTKVQRLCERARHAIVDRLIDLCPESQDATTIAEREELEEASRKLTEHEHAHQPR